MDPRLTINVNNTGLQQHPVTIAELAGSRNQPQKPLYGDTESKALASPSPDARLRKFLPHRDKRRRMTAVVLTEEYIDNIQRRLDE